MRKRIIKICLLLLIAISIIPMKSVRASESILPTAYDNLNISTKSTSELVATDSGYMRVFYNGNKICIEYYDNDFNIQSKKSIEMELSIWGGFFAGENAYYVVEGQNNKEENSDAEVIRVIKYDTDWNKLGTAKITSNPKLFGGEVGYPFHAGCVEMSEYNGTLYIVTGHRGYVDPSVGQGHQGFLMIAVDQASMTGEIVKSDLWHSFAQYIDCKESDLYVLEQSEGSRCTSLSKYSAEDLKEQSIEILEYGGNRTSAWAVSCYASVDDMALSSNNVLCLGTSIDQSEYDNVSSDTAHNIYLTITPMDDFTKDSTTVKWLTDYSGEGKSFLGTKITKVNDDHFMISWEEYNVSQTANIDDTLSSSVLHYIFIDGSGNKTSEEFTAAASISDCHPIVKDSKIVFYASNDNMVDFYSIDAYNGDFSKKIYRVAGENITWNLNNDTLTISGTKDISVNTKAKYRYPVSTTASILSYSSSDNAWKPIRENVKKIVINKGITSISDNAFNGFNNLTEVEIAEGVKSIGKEAFYSCNALSKITIPSSVTSIGKDFLWTGYYWVSDDSHVIRATIYAPCDSYAIKYARQEGIKYQLTGTKRFKISDTTISSIKNQTYTGSSIYPSFTVKDGKINLVNGRDYTVSYSNNKNTGKAKITITGKGNYAGTITKYFYIIPKKVGGVTNKTQTTSSITVKWNNATGATGYELYKYDEAKKKYVKVATTKGASYTVKKLKAGKTYKFKVRAYKEVSGKKYYGSYSDVKSLTTKTSTPKISKLSTKSKKATIQWNKISGATGYEIYMSTSKNGKYSKITTVKKGTTVKYTKTKLTKNKTYYFKVRAYKTINKKNIYSSYSDAKAIKVK